MFFVACSNVLYFQVQSDEIITDILSQALQYRTVATMRSASANVQLMKQGDDGLGNIQWRTLFSTVENFIATLHRYWMPITDTPIINDDTVRKLERSGVCSAQQLLQDFMFYHQEWINDDWANDWFRNSLVGLGINRWYANVIFGLMAQYYYPRFRRY